MKRVCVAESSRCKNVSRVAASLSLPLTDGDMQCNHSDGTNSCAITRGKISKPNERGLNGSQYHPEWPDLGDLESAPARYVEVNGIRNSSRSFSIRRHIFFSALVKR